MENLIHAKFSNYNWGSVSKKALRTVIPIWSQDTVIKVFWDRRLYIKWYIIDSLHNPDLSTMWPLITNNVIFKDLVYWFWENVALYGWAGISANGKVWSMHNANTQGTMWGERRPKYSDF